MNSRGETVERRCKAGLETEAFVCRGSTKTSPPKCCYGAVTGRSRTSRTSQPQAEAGTASTADEPLPAADHHQACAELQREPVSGVRRVWGTLRSATIYVVKNTICTVSSLSSVKEMHVKRKTQPGRSGKDRWWFLLHGKENDLKSLEDMWERIKLQTGWKLEVCTRPVKGQPPSPAENASHADETAPASVPTSANPTTTTCPHTPASTSKATPQSPTGADPGFVNRGFVINARIARGKFLGGHAYF